MWRAANAAPNPSGTAISQGQRKPEARATRSHARAARHGGEGRGGRDHRRTRARRAQNATAPLARLEAGGLERLPVDDEAAANHERAAARPAHRSRASHAETRPSFKARHLAIRDDVAEVCCGLHPESHGKLDPVDVAQLVEHVFEARRPRDSHHRAEPRFRRLRRAAHAVRRAARGAARGEEAA